MECRFRCLNVECICVVLLKLSVVEVLDFLYLVSITIIVLSTGSLSQAQMFQLHLDISKSSLCELLSRF